MSIAGPLRSFVISQHSAAAELKEIINGDGYLQDTDTFANIWYLRVRGEN